MTEATEKTDIETKFSDLGLSPKLLESLERMKFIQPTPIQAKAIPAGLEGKDIFGIAQTGTGKTLAFGLPMIQRIAREGGRGLVVLPTRELALQVEESLDAVAGQNGLRTAVLIGGASMEPQLKKIKAKPHVIVATPGRLLDHLEQKNLNLKDVRVLVLDEADRMLDMGFMPQVRRILMATPKDRQTMLFSATMPDQITHLAERYMRSPVRVEVDRAGTPAELVDHRLYVIDKDKKNRLLDWLLSQHQGTVLVFTRTRHGAARVCRAVRRMGHQAAEIHSDRSLAQRRAALDGFKSGQHRVLVATDIAARGIDVTGIELVVNYDVPENPEDYVHRIGRTGRAGERGLAITMAVADQGKEIQQIEKFAQIMLDIAPLPELPPDRPRPPRREGRRRDRVGRDRSGRDRVGRDRAGRERSGKGRRRRSEENHRPAASGAAGRLKPSRSISEGPVGIGVSDMGEALPEIGASFFEGTIDEAAPRKSGSSRKGRRRRRRK